MCSSFVYICTTNTTQNKSFANCWTRLSSLEEINLYRDKLTSDVRVQGGGLDKRLWKVDEESLPSTALVLECPGMGPEHRMTGPEEDVWAGERTGVSSLSLSLPGAQAEVPAGRNFYSKMFELGSWVQLAAVVRGSPQ